MSRQQRANDTDQAVVKRRGQLFKIEPDVERAGRGYVDVKPELLQARKHMVALLLEVPLQGNLP